MSEFGDMTAEELTKLLYGPKAGLPKCPTCKQTAPRRSLLWCHPFGHRCPHGEPCPAWTKDVDKTTNDSVCEVCRG